MIDLSKTFESFKNSEFKQDLDKMKEEIKEAKSIVKEIIESSQNPIIEVTRSLTDRIPINNTTLLATKIMRTHYEPDFDVLNFEREVHVIFKQIMYHFNHDDLESIQILAEDNALGLFTGIITARRERVN